MPIPRFEIDTRTPEEHLHVDALNVLMGYWYHLGTRQKDLLRSTPPDLVFSGHLARDRKIITSLARHDLVEKVAPEEQSPRMQKWRLSPLGAEVHKHLAGKCTYRNGDYAC